MHEHIVLKIILKDLTVKSEKINELVSLIVLLLFANFNNKHIYNV